VQKVEKVSLQFTQQWALNAENLMILTLTLLEAEDCDEFERRTKRQSTRTITKKKAIKRRKKRFFFRNDAEPGHPVGHISPGCPLRHKHS
jgi:hypothetical protein